MEQTPILSDDAYAQAEHYGLGKPLSEYPPQSEKTKKAMAMFKLAGFIVWLLMSAFFVGFFLLFHFLASPTFYDPDIFTRITNIFINNVIPDFFLLMPLVMGIFMLWTMRTAVTRLVVCTHGILTLRNKRLEATTWGQITALQSRPMLNQPRTSSGTPALIYRIKRTNGSSIRLNKDSGELVEVQSPNEFVNEHALLGLGKQKERVPVDQLLALLPCDSDPPEKSDEEHGEPDQAEDEDEQEMTSLLVNALLELEAYASIDVLRGFLQHENERVRAGAQKALAELATKGLRERVIRPWLSRYDEHLVRMSVVEAHAALGDAVDLAFWLEALEDDGDESLAVGAACVLEQCARVIPATIATLAPTCNLPGMRLARLRAWSMLGEVDKLLNAARSETNNQARWRAIEILGELHDPRALEPLIQLLRDEDDSRLLLAVLRALRAFGSAVPPEPLLETCGYRDYESRDWCVFEREPGIEAAAALKQAHPDAFRALVPLAEAMLRGEAPADVFASRSRSQIADAMKGIGRAGSLMLTHLSESLDWPQWQVHMKAAQALGKLRRNIPGATICRLLELHHDPQSRAVCGAADEALAEIFSLEMGIKDD